MEHFLHTQGYHEKSIYGIEVTVGFTLSHMIHILLG